MTNDQPRQAAGTTGGTGGQYAETQREAPVSRGVRLDEGSEGTFRFPPILRTAEEVVDFFSRVEVPDDVLERLVPLSYQVLDDNQARFRASYMQRAMRRWKADNPKPDDPARALVWERELADHEQKVTATADELSTKVPTRVEWWRARGVARMLKMYRQARLIGNEAERDRLLDTPVTIYNQTEPLWRWARDFDADGLLAVMEYDPVRERNWLENRLEEIRREVVEVDIALTGARIY